MNPIKAKKLDCLTALDLLAQKFKKLLKKSVKSLNVG